ncbi:MAG: NADH-quinone oxidoreductase subunit NuoK [Gammaproteobacteria bacterium]|nr:NADH-quinone oxidoreductase subunit NuoK [Gammaproteobacteria bacterium]
MTAVVPLSHSLALALVLFALGLLGVLVRRNLIVMLLCMEIMLNAVGLAFVAAGAHWQSPDGQVMFVLVLTFAATEVAVGLALLLQIWRCLHTIDSDAVDRLRG